MRYPIDRAPARGDPGDPPAAVVAAGDLSAVLAGLLAREAFGRAQLVAQESGERRDAVATRLGLVSEAVRAAPPPDPGLSLAFLRDCRALAIAVQAELVAVAVAVAVPFDGFVAPAFAYVYGRAVARVVGRVVGRKSDIEARIEAFAEADPDMTADGFAKAAQGLTTVEDVLRVAQDGAA